VEGKPNQSIEAIETELSKYNASTCDFINFKAYLKIKLQSNKLLISKYQSEIYRKYKWYGYINRQKTEQQMINGFKKKFGEPDKVCILIGDWDERGKYMKGKPPTKGIGIRRLFRKANYNLLLVNEYNTSCKLYKKGNNLVKCRDLRTPLALKMLTDKKEETINQSKITIKIDNKSKTKSKTLKTPLKSKIKFESIEIISRDLNGSLNILLKGRCIMENKEIPEYMRYKKTIKPLLDQTI
jgi:hypothetical protein